jgi:hypothetical protein
VKPGLFEFKNEPAETQQNTFYWTLSVYLMQKALRFEECTRRVKRSILLLKPRDHFLERVAIRPMFFLCTRLLSPKRFFVAYDELDGSVRPFKPRYYRVEVFCLPFAPAEAVKDRSFFCIQAKRGVGKQGVDEPRGQHLTGVIHLADSLTELAVGTTYGTKHLAGSKVSPPEFLREELRLRPLAGTWPAEEEYRFSFHVSNPSISSQGIKSRRLL